MIPKNIRSRNRLGLALTVGLCLCLPVLMGGGCPDFRNGVVDAVEGATRGLLLEGGQPQEAFQTAALGVLSALVTLIFDQLRTDQTFGSRF